ncbi:MAG: NAD(P)-dependent oxidoreductase [Solirubrobacterales bacterium]
MSGTVVVLGPSTYVGAALTSRLLESGKRVIGVSGRPAIARIFLPPESDQLKIASPENARELIGDPGMCSIVNLAEIADTPSSDLLGRDRRTRTRWRRRLADSIREIAPNGPRQLIQISSSGVFGQPPGSAPVPEEVRLQPIGDPEAESQLLMERTVARHMRSVTGELAIVRLGCVIGPGAPLWVAEIAQRIMEMKPVAYLEEEGFMNATHVENAADYLAALVDLPNGALREFGAYHHLAEYSSHRWSELYDVIAAQIGRPWNAAARGVPAGSVPGNPVKRLLKRYARSKPGGYLRMGVALLPESRPVDRVLSRATQAPPPDPTVATSDPDDSDLLDALSAPYEFSSHTIDGWSPALDFSRACAGIAEWLRVSGYSLRPPSTSSS